MAALKTRHKDLMAEYGGIALLTYLTIFAVVLVGFASAIKLGFNVDGADEQQGDQGPGASRASLTSQLHRLSPRARRVPGGARAPAGGI